MWLHSTNSEVKQQFSNFTQYKTLDKTFSYNFESARSYIRFILIYGPAHPFFSCSSEHFLGQELSPLKQDGKKSSKKLTDCDDGGLLLFPI